ncbi:MAG: hypothetical protein ACHQ9S_10820 [Candidatus Binatia bacterium]
MKQTVVQLSHRTRQLRVIAGSVLWATLLTIAPPSARAAEPITADTVAQRVAAAKTARDHEELAAYFRSQAAAMGEDAKRHEAMLKSYDWVWGVTKEVMRNHCQSLIASDRKAQQALEALAQEHEKLAKELEHSQ